MLDYTGICCPVCGKAFKESDDIVVCPECGAPYHRECYNKEGKCIFDDLHEKGEEWKPPQTVKPAETSAEIKDKECPVCGTLNAHSSHICTMCGSSLDAPKTEDNGGPKFTSQPYYTAGGMYGAPFAFDPMGGVSPAEVLEGVVTYGDASKLVRQNTNYYMSAFRYMKQTGKNKFNFAAFIFSGLWMLYRRQYKKGAMITALMFIFYIGYQCALYLVSYPTYVDLALRAGLTKENIFTPTTEQYMAISNIAAAEPSSALRLFTPFIMLIALFVIMIIVGIRGNRMYMEHCVETMAEIKSRSDSGDDMKAMIDARSGVNPMITMCLGICFFLISNVLPLLLVR